MLGQRRLLSILTGGCLFLWLLLLWFFGNFFYDLFWAFLEDRHVIHAKVTAFALAGLFPFLLTVVLIALIYLAVRHEFAKGYAGRANLQSAQLSSAPTGLSDALSINVGDTEPYKVLNVSDGNSREIVRVEVANISERHLAGCRLEMESMEPDDVAEPIVLRENFSLAPGGRNHTDVALLDTIVGEPASTIIFILSSGVRVPLRDDSYILRFRATTENSECHSDCHLWIEAGVLRLQKIS